MKSEEKKMVTKSLWELQFGYVCSTIFYHKPKVYEKPRTGGASINGIKFLR